MTEASRTNSLRRDLAAEQLRGRDRFENQRGLDESARSENTGKTRSKSGPSGNVAKASWSRKRALRAAEDTLVPKVGLLAENSFLATVKAVGRVTRVSQDGVAAVARGAVHAVAWANDVVMCSAKHLNPLTWTKRPAKKEDAENSRPGEPAAPPRPRPRKEPRAGVPVASAPPTLRQNSATAGTGPSSVANADIPRIRARSVSDGSRVPRARDAGPEPARSRRKERAKRTSRRAGNRAAIPPEVRYEEAAVAEFASVTDRVMFARALRNLASENARSRAKAAQVLGGIQHGLSPRALSATLHRDSSEVVRRECVVALTALGAREGLPAVEHALSDASSSVRLAAVRGVYRLAGSGGASSLVRMFSDKDEDVRRRAAACLGWLGQKHLAGELRPLLRGQSASVRLAALEALGNLGSSAVVDDVIKLLDDPEDSVQRRAFQVLRTITGRQMGEAFPEDEDGRRFLIARWRAWRERKLSRQEG